jgi:hypothetical protein
MSQTILTLRKGSGPQLRELSPSGNVYIILDWPVTARPLKVELFVSVAAHQDANLPWSRDTTNGNPLFR